VFKSIPPTSPHRVLCCVSSPELSELRANLKNKGFAEYLSDTPSFGKMVEYSSVPLVGRLSSIRAVEVASHVEEVVKTQEDGLGTLRIEGFWLRSKKSNGHVSIGWMRTDSKVALEANKHVQSSITSSLSIQSLRY
jgi:hypothetical protein